MESWYGKFPVTRRNQELAVSRGKFGYATFPRFALWGTEPWTYM